MIDVKTKVSKALKSALGKENVFASFPAQATKFPCVSYHEASNTPFQIADDDEYLSEISYMINIWGYELAPLTKKIDEAMRKIGFMREFSHEMPEPYEPNGARRKVMRYKMILGDDDIE